MQTQHILWLEVTASYVLYKYAAEYEQSLVRFSDERITANLIRTSLEAQYMIAQNRWIAHLKAVAK